MIEINYPSRRGENVSKDIRKQGKELAGGHLLEVPRICGADVYDKGQKVVEGLRLWVA